MTFVFTLTQNVSYFTRLYCLSKVSISIHIRNKLLGCKVLYPWNLKMVGRSEIKPKTWEHRIQQWWQLRENILKILPKISKYSPINKLRLYVFCSKAFSKNLVFRVHDDHSYSHCDMRSFMAFIIPEEPACMLHISLAPIKNVSTSFMMVY